MYLLLVNYKICMVHRKEERGVTCVSAWAKVVPCVEGSVLLLMPYWRILLDQNTSELFTSASDDYEQQLTTKTVTTDT